MIEPMRRSAPKKRTGCALGALEFVAGSVVPSIHGASAEPSVLRELAKITVRMKSGWLVCRFDPIRRDFAIAPLGRRTDQIWAKAFAVMAHPARYGAPALPPPKQNGG